MRRFVEEYAIDFNATQAAIRAGYSKRSAASIGDENLRKPEIRAALGKVLADLRDSSQLTAKRVLEELAAVAFVRLGDYVNSAGDLDVVRLAREQPAAMAELETTTTGKKSERVTKRRTKLHDKLQALVALGRYFKLFQTEVKPRDVPKDATPRAVYDYTTEELLQQIARDEEIKHGSTGKRRRKR
jgi:phage terminase small subunit